MKKLLILFLAALTLAACSSDNEEGSASSSTYQYTAEEITQINNLQEEYGVKLNLTQSSNHPLSTIAEVEEMCKIVAKMQMATRHYSIKGDTVTFTNRAGMRRSYGTNAEREGSDVVIGNIKGYDFEYRINWSRKSSKDYSFSVDIITMPNVMGFQVDYLGESHSLVGGGSHLVYTLKFELYEQRTGKVSTFDITDEIYLQ